MGLSRGSHLGPYEIVAPLGAGGMGEVYRARDPRLGREVAIKVLPASFAGDDERVRRFAREAAAAGRLNHPNILTVHDVGTETSFPYLVTELLEGETLRDTLSRGPLPRHLAIDYAVQVARALATAHEHGIVHRDLKPENLFVTREGRIKVLDFGLAKPISAPSPTVQTAATLTEAGTLLGTAGYMAPEQILGNAVDARVDLFAFGVILLEMLTGTSPFRKPTTIETLNAILTTEPTRSIPDDPRGVLWTLIDRLLAKDPERRLRSAYDAALLLELVQAHPRKSGGDAAAARPWRTALVALATMAALAAVLWLGMRSRDASDRPRYTALTDRDGTLWSARFAPPDRQTVVYSARWDADPVRVFSTRIGSAESRPLELRPASLLSVSSRGEMALLIDPRWILTHIRLGTLARADLAGGGVREMASNVLGADWSPDGTTMAIIRSVDGEDRLEYPAGNLLYRTRNTKLHHVRVSPDGERLAFFERLPDSTQVVVITRSGERTVLSKDWQIVSRGLAWRPDGREVWFSATRARALSLFAVSLDGRHRSLVQVPQNLELLDVAPNGSALASSFSQRSIMAVHTGRSEARIVSSSDSSFLLDMSPDGRDVLYNVNNGLRLQHDDSAPVLLTTPTQRFTGWASLSPDRRQVAAVLAADPQAPLTIVPTGAGDERQISYPGEVKWAAWTASQRILVARIRDRRVFFHEHQLDSGAVTQVLADATLALGDTFDANVAARAFQLSPDARQIVVQTPEGIHRAQLPGGRFQRVPGAFEGYTIAGWSDERHLSLYRIGDVPARLMRLDLDSGTMQPYLEVAPFERGGLWRVHPIHVSALGAYAYLAMYNVSDLYLIEGLK